MSKNSFTVTAKFSENTKLKSWFNHQVLNKRKEIKETK
jgi:hypothetical protein